MRISSINMAVLWLLLFALTLGCAAKRTGVKPYAEGRTLRGDLWAYNVEPAGIIVYATSEEAKDAALKALGCGICAIEHIGDIYKVNK